MEGTAYIGLLKTCVSDKFGRFFSLRFDSLRSSHVDECGARVAKIYLSPPQICVYSFTALPPASFAPSPAKIILECENTIATTSTSLDTLAKQEQPRA